MTPRRRSTTAQPRRGVSTHLVRVADPTLELLDAIRAAPGRHYASYDRVVRIAVTKMARELGIPLDRDGLPVDRASHRPRLAVVGLHDVAPATAGSHDTTPPPPGHLD